MALRKAHGNAAAGGVATVQETLPVDELPSGTPENADDESRSAKQERGRFAPGNKRSVLGGRARKGKPRLVERVSLTAPSEKLPTAKYHQAAKAFARSTSQSLARYVGGGQLDPHVSYMATAAARAAKWANYLSDVAERLPEGSKEQRDTISVALAADERASAHLRNAHEYAAKMAVSREAAERNNFDFSDFYQNVLARQNGEE